MTRQMTDLTEENAELKQELIKLRSEISSAPKNPVTFSNDALELINANKNQLDHLFNERLELRRQFMECESSYKKTQLNIHMRKLDGERMNALSKSDNATKNETSLAGLHNKRLYYADQKSTLEKELEQNKLSLVRLESDLKSKTGQNDWVVESYFRDKNLIAEFKDTSYQEKHALEVMREFTSRLESNEDVILDAMSIIRHLSQVMNGMNRLTDEMKNKLRSLERRIEGKKNVAWGDEEGPPVTALTNVDFEEIISLSIYSAMEKSPQPVNKRALTHFCKGRTPSPLC